MRTILVVFLIFNIILVVKSSSEEKKDDDDVSVEKKGDDKDDKEDNKEKNKKDKEEDTEDSEEESDSDEISSEEGKDVTVDVTKPTAAVTYDASVVTETTESFTTKTVTSKANLEKTSTTTINYPFSVSIQRKGSHYANGALVGKKWILTCAGEFYNVRESTKLYRVRLGSVDCKRGGILVPVKSIELHPSYKHGLPDYDLAMVKLAKSVDYTDFIRPIGLSNVKTKIISAKFMTTYWPRLIVGGQVLPPDAAERLKSNSMRVSTQRLIPREACVLRVNFMMEEFTLCLNPFTSHHTRCVPDPGAPVVAEDGLWGITSGWVSHDCNTTQSPTIFSRISESVIRNWVDSQMDSN